MQVTSFVLKIIAIISMLIDHTTVALYEVIPGEMWDIYDVGRWIGRTAFPLFCFMIVEGYYHTRNKWRYLGSLIFLAFISELPFDALIENNGFVLEFSSQNVFFTLALGLFTVILIDGVNEKVQNVFLSKILQFIIILLISLPAIQISSDYGIVGVVLILFIYYFEKMQGSLAKINGKFATDKTKFVLAGMAVFLWLVLYDALAGRVSESFGFPAVILIMLYNGQRGNYRIPKYVFYFFYPVHLIILCFIRKSLVGY